MLDLFVSFGYIGMFISALLAGSVFPFSSEAVFLALLGMGLDPLQLTIYASIGNVLGSMINYSVGRMGRLDWIEKYLHVKKESLDRAEKFMAGHGAWIGFLAFLPILGSAISVMLGFMRANVYITTISITLGKVLRYSVLALIFVYGSSVFVDAISWLWHQLMVLF